MTVAKSRGPSRAQQRREIATRERRIKPVIRQMMEGIPKILTPSALRDGVAAGQISGPVLERLRDHVRSFQDPLLAALDPSAVTKQEIPDMPELASLQIGNLIAELTDRQLATAREALQVLFEQGPTPEALTTISDATGLTSRQLRAVENARLAALDAGATKTVAARTARNVQRRLLRYRANLIARTESVNLAGAVTRRFGQEIGATRKTWVSARDANVEEICRALDGTTVGINEEFPGGLMGPAAHPGCRCVLDLE